MSELRRRRMFRLVIVYAVAAWAIIEVSATVLPGLNLPNWTVTFVIMVVLLSFPIVLILGWIFDLGPHGLERTAPVTAHGLPAPADASAVDRGTPAPSDRPQRSHLHPHTQAGRRTIAVLPFVNLSGDAENEYFSDGIAEEILNLLTRLPQLRVSSRTSSFYFKDSKVDIPTVADKLCVGTVLEGSVRRAGNRVRIHVQLVEAATDSQLWSENYDRELEDVFAIQDDIARSVVQALEVTLSPREEQAIQYQATANVQAYDFYLRGRKHFYAWSRRDSLMAIDMYKQAIEHDPSFAAAWAGLSDVYAMRYRFLNGNAEGVGKAMEASERALALDPDSAEAHASRGHALYMSKRHDEAERHFETAMMLNPNLFEPYFLYGMCCSARGRFEKAAWLYIRASEVSPAAYLPLVYLSQAYHEMGRREDEMHARRRATDMIERALQLDPDDARARYMGAANFATMGERDKAIEWANLALDSSRDEPMVYYNAACTFAVLDENERAIDLLERAVALGWGDRAWMANDSDLTSLRGHPRFNALLATLH